MNDRAYETVHLADLERVTSFQDVTWIPVRRRLGVEAFGVNAFSGEPGELVIEEHDETGSGGSGSQEELYFVVSGRATFTVAGDEIPGPAGTFVLVRDPTARRKAVAEEAGTVVLALGGTRGEAYTPSVWEWVADSLRPSRDGDFAAAAAILETGLEERPDHPSLLYNLACYEALGGKPEQALEHLQRAVEADAKTREWAAEDEDFRSLRGDERFERLLSP